MAKITWKASTELPDFPNEGTGNSGDVLVFDLDRKNQDIGYFNFNQMKWFFQSGEDRSDFKWREFTDEHDKP